MENIEDNYTWPTVTIVTVVYNLINAGRREYFKQCVESVHSQIYPYIEHIVIDGGSKDGTVDLLNEYKNKGYITYYSEPDKGLYDAMNKGIKKATGKYVAFLNSDDFFHSVYAVEKSVTKLEEERADFSCASCRYVNNEKTVAIIPPRLETFFCRMPFCHQTMFTKRNILLKEKGFDTDNLRSAADWDLTVRIFLNGYKPVIVDNCITSFRYGGFCCNTIGEKEDGWIRKKYFPYLTVKKIQKSFKCRDYDLHFLINKQRLNDIKSKVSLTVRSAISNIEVKCVQGKVRLFIRNSYTSMCQNYSILMCNFFRLERIDWPQETHRFCFRVFSIKLFEVKETQSKTIYRFLYLPFLVINKNY